MWIIAGFIIATSELKIRGCVKGILLSFLLLAPTAIIIGWHQPVSLIPITIMTLVLGSGLGYSIQKFGTSTAVYSCERGDYYINADKTTIDFAFTHEFVSQETWWGKGRSVEKMRLAIEHSMCFGLYERTNGLARQIGFARVVTDYSTFAYIADVFVIPEQRGKGFGKWLVEAIVNHPQLCELRRVILFTRTPKFYQPLGFADYLPGPEVSNFMVWTPQKMSG